MKIWIEPFIGTVPWIFEQSGKEFNLSESISRRIFMARAAGAGQGAAALPAAAYGRVSGANERIRWDAEKETAIGDREAMECISFRRDYRAPWKLPIHEA